MSSSSQTPESSSHFKSILDAALGEYKSKTGNDLTDHSLAKELQSCESAEAVLDIIRREAKAFVAFRDGEKRLMKWIIPSVQVLHTISEILGHGANAVRINDLRLQAHPTACAGVSCCECGLCRDRSASHCSFIVFLIISPLKSFNADVL